MHSPSGLAALELCPRKYAWDKVDGIPRTPNPYAEFGVRTHRILESYYLEGTMPDITSPEGNCAVALLAHLPPPQPGIRVEEHRIVGRFHGYPDLTLGARVWDHKTTSDHKWAKTPEALLEDLQACLYASFAFAETKAPTVTLQWNYVTREKRPRVLPVVLEVTPEAIAPTLQRAASLADQADEILIRQLHALELPPNPAACDAYGGCQHRQRCNLTSAQRMSALMAQHQAKPVLVYGIRTDPETAPAGELVQFVTGGQPRVIKEENNMASAADFLADMKNKHPAPPPPPAGNPWDNLPADHLTPTSWFDRNAPGGPNWVPKAPPAPPPPPPAAAALPPPPAAPPVPINPPAPPGPALPPPSAAAPPPPVPPPPGPMPHAGSPTATPAPLDAALASDITPHELIACALEDLATGIRLLGGKRGPGRPRKAKP